jgi:hypothetical protein
LDDIQVTPCNCYNSYNTCWLNHAVTGSTSCHQITFDLGLSHRTALVLQAVVVGKRNQHTLQLVNLIVPYHLSLGWCCDAAATPFDAAPSVIIVLPCNAARLCVSLTQRF